MQVTATEHNGDIDFTIDVQEGATTADLRALFFHFTEAKLAGLTFTETGGTHYLTETRVQANSVIDLGDNANLNGSGRKPFDIGMEWGTPGQAKDDIYQAVTFTLSRAQHDLTVDDIGGKEFGATLGSVGGPGGARSGVSKITGIAPHAPDAHDDSFTGFEDGAAGLNSPSHVGTPIKLDVLANDTDADGDTLSLIAGTHDGPSHGVVTTDGHFLYYTPDLDWSGSDSFEYCMSDGHGGQDHATATITIAAVADEPVVTYSVAAGANANELLITVTGDEDDADSSEFIDKLVAGSTPAGVTVSPGVWNPAAEDNVVSKTFTVTTAPHQDYNFNMDFFATSKEVSNGDEETNSVSVPIVIEYNENDYSADFLATDQNIWDSGAAFTFTDDRFLGIDDGFSDSGGSLIGYEVSGHVKAGFQSTLHFTGGDVDASLSYDLGIDTTFNKTTDSLLISTSKLLTDGDFKTIGPEGSYKLDFILNYLFHAALTYDIGVDSGDIVSFDDSEDFSINVLDLNSADLATTIEFPPPLSSLSATLAWPHVTTDGDASPPPTGEFTGHGESNNFLQLNIDIDQALADIFLGGANPFDLSFDVGFAWGSLEILDLDVYGGLNFIQNFIMQEQPFTGILHFEDGTDQAFTFGTDLLLQNASAIDAGGDGDGLVEFTLELDAQASLHNETDLGINIGYNFDVLKVSGGYDIGVDADSFSFGPVLDFGGQLPVASVEVYDNTFGLNFAPQSFSFFA